MSLFRTKSIDALIAASEEPEKKLRRTLGPCASTGTYSRLWSVEGVVGSQPWSAVKMARSPSCIAETIGFRIA